jgi:hypothetical protein
MMTQLQRLVTRAHPRRFGRRSRALVMHSLHNWPMYTFVVREMSYGALLPLARLIERMHLSDVASWRFHWIDLHGGGCPFGMTFDEFEAASRVPDGLEVRDSEFRAFLNSDFQVVEGEIEAWSNDVAPICLARIDCHDASEWELTTDIPEVASRLEQSGFPRA